MRKRSRIAAWAGLLCVLPLSVAAGAPPAPFPLSDLARRIGFEVGAAIDTTDTPAQRLRVALEFTSVTAENAMKWTPLSPAPGVYDFTDADAVVAFAEASGQRVRGHTLFWDRLNGRPAWLPGELAAAPDSAARLMELMQDHARTVVGRYAGRIAQWDVVNEPLELLGPNVDPINLFVAELGEAYIDIAFATAHAADPNAALFLNETLAVSLPRKFDGLIALAERLLARGVPLHGIGLQGHYYVDPPERAVLQSQLQRIAALGLLVELTEVDIPIFHFGAQPDPFAAQGEAYGAVFEACLAVPACTGITTWGIDDSDTWLDSFILTSALRPNRPLLFNIFGFRKPAYFAAVAALEAALPSLVIDIKPDDTANRIDPTSRGVVPLALLGSESFDVAQIDPATLAFGPGGAAPAHRNGPHAEDVSRDGIMDRVVHFRTPATGLAVGDTEACLTGETFDGMAFEACDAIDTLPACGLGVELPLVLLPWMRLRRRRQRLA
jgi:endo-1,4-beta-xylanase